MLSLDAGGVLVHPDWRAVALLAATVGYDLDVERLAIAEHVVVAELDTPAGVLDDQRRWFEFMARVLRRGGLPEAAIPDLLSLLHAEHAKRVLWRSVPLEVPDVLAELRARGHRLAVLSNSNGRLRAMLDELDLSRWFDLILDSAVEGLEKPDPRFFGLLYERLDVPASAVLHVGDVFHIDVVGARAAGCRPLLLDKASLRTDWGVETVRALRDLL